MRAGENPENMTASRHASPQAWEFRLAEAFASAIGDLADLVLDVLQDGHVTRENLDRLALLAPSEIGSESDERRPCQNVLLTPAGANDEAGRRAAGPFF